MRLTLIFATYPAILRITGRFCKLFPKMSVSLNYATPAFTLVGSKAAYVGRCIPTFGTKTDSLFLNSYTDTLVYSISEFRFYSSSFHFYFGAPFLSLSPCPHCLTSPIPAHTFVSSLNHLTPVYFIPAPLFVSYFFTVTLMSPIPPPLLDSSVYHS
jgi:hypothetical protein